MIKMRFPHQIMMLLKTEIKMVVALVLSPAVVVSVQIELVSGTRKYITEDTNPIPDANKINVRVRSLLVILQSFIFIT